MEFISDSVIFYVGIALAGVSALLAIISIPVFLGRKRRLGMELDEEYGKRELKK